MMQAVAALAILFALSSESLSAIISRDFHNLNDGLLIYDTQTGREWLALSQTNTLTVEQMRLQLESGPLLGFAIATSGDVKDLARSANLGVSNVTLDFLTTLSFIDTMNGQPQSSPHYRFAQGAVADAPFFADYTRFSITAVLEEIPGALNQPVGPGHYAYWQMASLSYSPPQERVPGGFWLFRDSGVPEPSLLSMLLAAVALSSVKCRFRR